MQTQYVDTRPAATQPAPATEVQPVQFVAMAPLPKIGRAHV